MRAGILDATDGQIPIWQRSRAFVANPALLELDLRPFAGVLILRFGHGRILTRNTVIAYNRSMPRVAVNEQVLTFDQYLEIEASAETRHEFVDGLMFAMAGATEAHNLIALNIATTLRAAARATACRVFQSDMKYRTADNTGYYPDVILTCDERDLGELVKRFPCLLVEVLSKSTSEVDHTEKWLNYQRIPSLNMYVMVTQDRRFLEVYTRQVDGSWRYETLEDAGTLKFACVNASMTLDDVYEDVIFPNTDS